MTPAVSKITSAQACQIAEAGYIFGYPLVLMDITRQVATNVRCAGPSAAPINQFAHRREFPDETFTSIVSPNADTLYSFAHLDLSNEPIVLSIPALGPRYYLMPLLDAWTNVFASPGSRTTGQDGGDFAIVGPSWRGTLPPGVNEIKAPTNSVWLVGRTQTNGKSDCGAVHAIQDRYRLAPLSVWNEVYIPPVNNAVDPRIDMRTPPIEQVANLTPEAFFSRLAKLMKTNSPAPADAYIIANLASIGVAAGKSFDSTALDPETVQAVRGGVAAAKARIMELPRMVKGTSSNGWTWPSVIGKYGTDYEQRAAIAFVGLGANIKEDALYPLATVDSDGRILNGANRYAIHFEKGQLPPVNAFWSITIYNDRHLLAPNPIKRFAIGDRDDLKFNADGSLDICIQCFAPGREKEANWLPAPPGNFSLILRMYWPKPQAVGGTWKPPAVRMGE